MKNNKYDITASVIRGIKNPGLRMMMSVQSKEFEIQVLADDKEIEYFKTLMNKKKNIFTIDADIPKGTKKVKVLLTVDNKTYKIVEKSNSIVLRVFFRMLEIIGRFFKKIYNFCKMIIKGVAFLWKEHHFIVPKALWKKYLKAARIKLRYGYNMYYNPFNIVDYNKWLKENEKEPVYEELKYNPLISIVIPVYNIERDYLSDCLDSILNQHYTNFEICIADDNSSLEETKKVLKEYEKKDKRVKVVYRKENGHISEATNSAIKIAKGEFIALMDDDDVISENALYEVVKVLNEDKSIDMIYSDEDKMTVEGERCDPHFKPDYSPDTLLGSNYICHFTVLRKKIVEEIGGFDSKYNGAQDYDLFLKFVEKTNKIYHIPKILYHWRKVPGSTADTIDNKTYAIEAGKEAVEMALKRRGLKGIVEVPEDATCYAVKYTYKKEPKISIIIPTKNYSDILKKCVDSILEKTTYKNYEIIICDNGSTEEQAIKLMKDYEKNHKNIKIVDCNFEFNYSKINNIGVKKASGEYIVLLNNDTEVITPDWLERMVGYAMQKHIGTVGAKLLYPDDTVQHAGVILGIGGVASHSSVGYPRESLGHYGRLIIPYNYAGNTAACLMVKKSKYNEVGGLNENLKVAYNDVDFNLKILQKGYYNVCNPRVELYHYESKSRGLDTTTEKYRRFLKEQEYMYETWGDILGNDPFYNRNLSLNNYMILDKVKKEAIRNYIFKQNND